ncbi:hypothetical protein Emag_000625 [Eimeria magna]
MWHFASCPQSLAAAPEGGGAKEALGAPTDVDKQGTLPQQEQEPQLPQCVHPAVSRQLVTGASDIHAGGVLSGNVGRGEGLLHEQTG